MGLLKSLKRCFILNKKTKCFVVKNKMFYICFMNQPKQLNHE